MKELTIRAMTTEDWSAVRTIYGEGIATGNATFEVELPEWLDWDRDHTAEHRWVATDGDGDVVGWVAAQRVSARQVYAGVLETSIYVAGRAQRVGVGGALLRALVDSTEQAGVWTLQTGIFPENAASLALHERSGFRRLGVRARLGRWNGRWRDVVLLERRSSVVGS